MIIEIHLFVLISIIVFTALVGLIGAALLGSAKMGDLYMELAEIKRKDDLDRGTQKIEEQRSKLLETANEQLAMDLDILQKKYEKIYIELDGFKSAKKLSETKVDEKGRFH